MKIAFHSGLCCGIKVIWGFYNHPAEYEPSIEFEPWTIPHGQDADQYGEEVSPLVNFYNADCPRETCLERFERYLKYLDVLRPSGVAEAVLNYDDDDPWDGHEMNDIWGPIFLERGFKLVTEAKNSNSGNTIYIYHRKTVNGVVQ